MEDSTIIYMTFAFIGALYIWTKLRPPTVDKSIHKFSDKAVEDGHNKYEEIIKLNSDFEDKAILEDYALEFQSAIKYLTMYMESGQLSDTGEISRQADYWMKWTEYSTKRCKKLEKKYGLIFSVNE